MTRDDDSHGEVDMRVHNVDEGTNNGRPPRDQQGLGHRPRAARGGRADAGHGSRSRHAARGAETSGGG